MPKLLTLPDTPQTATGEDRLLSVTDVRRRLGNMTRQHLYALTRMTPQQSSQFPAPIHIGTRIYWSEWEISAWIEARKAARRHGR